MGVDEKLLKLAAVFMPTVSTIGDARLAVQASEVTCHKLLVGLMADLFCVVSPAGECTFDTKAITAAFDKEKTRREVLMEEGVTSSAPSAPPTAERGCVCM